MVNWIWIVEQKNTEGAGSLFLGAYQTRAKACKCAMEAMFNITFGENTEFTEESRARSSTVWVCQDQKITIRKVRVK